MALSVAARIRRRFLTSVVGMRNAPRPSPRLLTIPYSDSRSCSSTATHFQFMSDLHLELGQQYVSFDFPIVAPYLILAGDIGALKDYDAFLTFLKRQTARYKRVFLVLGNHEFYGMGYQSGLERAQWLASDASLEGRATLLHKRRYDLPDDSGISILGCTLWSQIPDESSAAIAKGLNDYRNIQGWTVESHSKIHSDEATWLQGQIREIKRDTETSPRAVLVVTHHAPMMVGSGNPRFDGSKLQSGFSTDVLSVGNWDPVTHWVFGHTHWTTNVMVNGVKVLSNQRGHVYPSPIRVRTEVLPPEHTFDATRSFQI